MELKGWRRSSYSALLLTAADRCKKLHKPKKIRQGGPKGAVAVGHLTFLDICDFPFIHKVLIAARRGRLK